MSACPRCGEENPAHARFCLACGEPLVEAAPPRELRKTVTVVFCDLTASTSLGERVDPEALRATMRRYYEEARSVLERHGGTVEKFIGDAVMAVFGVPQAHEDDALRAVRAAVELRDAVATLGLEARIGVNTGGVVAGDGDALVTGDAVNVAARLEQHAEPGEILIGSDTSRLVRDAVRTERVDLAVKGKSASVEAHRLLEADLAAPAQLRRLDTPFVGRERELRLLRDEFERTVAEGTSHLFSLIGPAGIGKSRLVVEFARAAGSSARVLQGRCLHYGEGITYWPVVEVLLQLGADAEAVLALPSPTEAAVATRKLLEAAAVEQPLVVVFDDIQWAEPTFLDLIEHVVDWSRSAPIFLLCIARPEVLELRAAWGGGKPNATSILLESLREDEASTLIDNLLGTRELSDELRGRIVAASEGNPLFVEEMLLMLRENGDGDGDVAVPPTIHALLQARIDRLDASERSVVERGAVEGEVFHRAPVAELAPPAVSGGLDEHLTTLIRKEVIRPAAPTFPGDDAFRFRHLLIRDTAYESLPKETRAELHARFADWLDAHVELVEQDEIVGYHLEQAARYRRELGRDDDGLAGRAAGRLASAGFAALARGDVRAGAGLLERAASLHPTGDEARLRLLPELAYALLDAGRFDEAAPYIAELTASPDERWQAHAALVRVYHAVYTGTGSLEEGEPELNRARATFERLGDEAGLAHALRMQAHVEWTRCRAEAAAALYREGLFLALRARNQRLVGELRGWLASSHVLGPTPVEELEREIADVVDATREVVTVDAPVQRALGRVAGMRGDFAEARDLMRRSREMFLERGNVIHANAALGEAEIARLAGDLDEAASVLREGFEQLDELGEHAYASTVAVRFADVLQGLGRDAEASHWVARGRELSPAGDVATLAPADYVEALLVSRAGDHERALELARRAAERAETTDFWQLRGSAFEALAQVLAAAGRAEEAREAQQEAIAVYEAKGVASEAKRARGLLAEL